MEFERVAARHTRRLSFVLGGIMVVGFVSPFAMKDPGFVVLFFVASFFALAVVPYLYAKYSRLACPECGSRLTMKTKWNETVTYSCKHCGFSHDTGIVVRSWTFESDPDWRP